MKRRWNKATLISALLVILLACVTINIYFPAAAVEKAADRIVKDTWGEKETPPKDTKKQEKPQSRIEKRLERIIEWAGPQQAWAQGADINISTPAIRSLKESIRRRSGSLKPFLDRGAVGISNQGLLTVRKTNRLSLKEKADLTRLIRAENRDREALYQEIAKANHFSADKVPEIQEIFAKSWISNARSGWWVQDSKGAWRRR